MRCTCTFVLLQSPSVTPYVRLFCSRDFRFLALVHTSNTQRNISRPPCPCLPSRQVIAGTGAEQVQHVCFFTLRDIAKDEELLYAYPPPHTVGLGEVIAPDCACRMPGCRGRISQREDPLRLF